jgi:ribonucleoside-diphosphate reductase alpha chain
MQRWKRKVTGANVSVKITDEFMNAVENKSVFRQQYPIVSDNPKFVRMWMPSSFGTR